MIIRITTIDPPDIVNRVDSGGDLQIEILIIYYEKT